MRILLAALLVAALLAAGEPAQRSVTHDTRQVMVSWEQTSDADALTLIRCWPCTLIAWDTTAHPGPYAVIDPEVKPFATYWLAEYRGGDSLGRYLIGTVEWYQVYLPVVQ